MSAGVSADTTRDGPFMRLLAHSHVNRVGRLVWLCSAYLLLSGCVGGTVAKIPTNIPDGIATHRFQSGNSAFEYTGHWRNSGLDGTGSGRDFDAAGQLTASCKGEFSSAPGGISARGQGEIYRANGTVIYRGVILSSLIGGMGCMPGPKGTYVSPAGWTLKGESFQLISQATGVYMTPGPCTLGDPQGNTWTGVCNLPRTSKHATIQQDAYKHWLPELEVYPTQIRFTSGGIVNFTLANGPGVMRYANGEQVEGNFDLGQLEDGLVRVTSADGKVSQAMAQNGKLGPRHVAGSQLAEAKPCGFPGWRIVSGRCEQNSWSGDVDAYDATGMERITGPFIKGAPGGTVTWSRLDSGLQVRGKMVANNGGLGFTQGQVSVAGVQAYEGEMSGFAPNGNGICTVNGSLERCEFINGERVDALYKTRVENDRLRNEIAANQQQKTEQQAQQQAAARRQAQAQAAAEEDSGDMFGKVMAIGIGAGAVSSVSGVSSTIRNQMITGMAADILTDGKADGIATAQRNLGVQSSAGSMQPVLSTLSGATMSNNGTLKGSSAVASNAGGDASTATLQNIAGMGSTAGHAERSQKLDDIVAKVAADSGLKTRKATYQCAPGDPVQSVTVPYKTEACAAAKKNWFSVYACNDVEHMNAANQQCIQGCGNANCDEQ
ncbi:hypothetical protein [Pseudomonas fluorescens]|uniref:Uncharacterized protein n=1 Tax=Pseudomonas fluorescens TaxID=294 RepID=A0A5E7F3I1_PSEFL|nr:hypothetical protein [Pseudomonas fluorescens]VVO33921.1 hypothetical protein PS691_05164 [Pseudomonas fluorescens]